MCATDEFTAVTLEIFNIERNILLGMLREKGVEITHKQLRDMARAQVEAPVDGHPYSETTTDVEKYDE